MSIVITQNICGGHPRIDGHRIEIFNIIGCLADSMSISEIADDYKISIDEVKDAIEWTREYLIKQFDGE